VGEYGGNYFAFVLSASRFGLFRGWISSFAGTIRQAQTTGTWSHARDPHPVSAHRPIVGPVDYLLVTFHVLV